MISYLDELPVKDIDIASATRKDPVVARTNDVTLHGWPQTVEDPVLQPYFSHRQNCLLTRDFCCGDYVLLFLKCTGNACWMTYNKASWNLSDEVSGKRLSLVAWTGYCY